MQRVGSKDFAMEVPVAGLDDLANRVLRVIITKPTGESFERLSAEDDVSVLSETLIGVRIIEGDFSVPGTYQLQIWDETTGVVKSDVQFFEVGPSLAQPE